VRFTPLELKGAYLIEPERIEDERGSFARTWCSREFAAAGLPAGLEQCSLSANKRRGTLRGLHLQADPHGEHKLVRCSRGAIFDVIVDLRIGSPTFRRWVAFELTADNAKALLIPPGMAHGFQTLADETDVFYQMAESFVPGAARGVRWNDPAFAIAWPAAERRIMSDRDAGYPDFDPAVDGQHG
jgi:dTDP-4-dehydrorhamnose 3,5-epimerase